MKIDKKINALFIVILLFLSVLLAVSFVFIELNQININTKEKGDIIITELATSIEFPLFVRDFETVEKLMQNSLKNKDVVYCMLKDRNGKIVFKTGDEEDKYVKVFEKDVLSYKNSEKKDEIIFGIQSEAKDKIGTITINISTEDAKRTVIFIVLLVFVLTIVAVIVAALFSHLLVKKILSGPINQLVQGTKKIADGDFSYKVPVNTKDEIGLLAQAFNKMSHNLSSTLISKEYTDTIFASMVEALFVTNINSQIEMVNDSASEMTGYSKDELIGKPVGNFFDSININGFSRMANNKERRCLSKNGETPVLFAVSELKDKSGKVTGFACVAVNITEMKVAEQKLKNAFVEIEKYTEDLEKSNTRLKELDKLKSDFLSMVSHELRTPLTSIKGYLSFMQNGVGGKLSSEQKEFLGSISRNAERLLKLINDLVDLTKIQRGNFDIDAIKSDIVEVVIKCINEISPMAESMNIQIIKKFYPPVINLFIDEYRISQVLINVLNNSVKFSPKNSKLYVDIIQLLPGEAVIPLYAGENNLTSKACCKITIKDEGIGMEKKYVEKIFEQFYQIEDINTRKYQGLGLGLNIAKNIVEAHGGKIWADSEGVEKGTSFCIILPMDKE